MVLKCKIFNIYNFCIYIYVQLFIEYKRNQIDVWNELDFIEARNSQSLVGDAVSTYKCLCTPWYMYITYQSSSHSKPWWIEQLAWQSLIAVDENTEEKDWWGNRENDNMPAY